MRVHSGMEWKNKIGTDSAAKKAKRPSIDSSRQASGESYPGDKTKRCAKRESSFRGRNELETTFTYFGELRYCSEGTLTFIIISSYRYIFFSSLKLKLLARLVLRLFLLWGVRVLGRD